MLPTTRAAPIDDVTTMRARNMDEPDEPVHRQLKDLARQRRVVSVMFLEYHATSYLDIQTALLYRPVC